MFLIFPLNVFYVHATYGPNANVCFNSFTNETARKAKRETERESESEREAEVVNVDPRTLQNPMFAFGKINRLIFIGIS